MNNNDLLRRLRSILGLSDAEMIAVFRLGGCAMNQPTLQLLLRGEDEDDFIPCADPLMAFFLDGLIIHRRGPRSAAGGPAPQPDAALNNNTILKKLRIALDLKEDDLLAILKLAGVSVSKSELTGLFRAKGHKHYKQCSDTFLLHFLQGLAIRSQSAPAAPE